MIRKLIDYAIENHFLVLAGALVLLSWAAIFFPTASGRGIARRSG
jgi:hypothetical protein